MRQPNGKRKLAIAKEARRLLTFDLESSYYRNLTKIAINGLAGYARAGWRAGKYKTPLAEQEIEFVCIELMGIVRRTKPTDIYGCPVDEVGV